MGPFLRRHAPVFVGGVDVPAAGRPNRRVSAASGAGLHVRPAKECRASKAQRNAGGVIDSTPIPANRVAKSRKVARTLVA